MDRLDFPYARALVSAAPLADLARAVVRRARRQSPAPFIVDEEARRLGADALSRAPGLFTAEPLTEASERLFPDQAARLRERAGEILAHRVELLGRVYELGPQIDWLRDPASGVDFDVGGDPGAVLKELLARPGADPKVAWELQRGAHLVELAAAGRVCAELEDVARVEVARQLQSFLEQVTPARGFAYASPLEVGLRAIHWLAAIELCGGARTFSRPWVERCAGALVADLHWLWACREEQGVAPANHLLGDLVGAWALALALDGAPGARPLLPKLRRAIEREAARQIGPDGAHFEASTGYHRFALELLLIAHLYARSSGRPLAVEEPLHRMFLYLRGILQPDGTDPGFGDADDARMVPIVPRDPLERAYLLPIGAALFGDSSLRPPGVPFSEEALWLAGPDAHHTWQWLYATRDAGSASFASGGVHVLRDGELYVAMRAGSYGQHGVGGHAHNDQLSLVVHAGGAPLIIDAGTGCYTQDPLLRDRLRATAAHSTVIVDGAEQSPIFEGRPFALPDRARASRAILADDGQEASLGAAHYGYRRLPARVTHRRYVTLRRGDRVLIVEDRLDGRGEVGVEVRFLLAGEAQLGASAATLARLARLEPSIGTVDPTRVVELDGRAALVPLGDAVLPIGIAPGLASPRWRSFAAVTLVAARGRLKLPGTLKHAIVFLD